MKKLLILISIIMLLFSVTVTLGEVMQEDLKALESLVDIMSSKVAENGETMGNMEGDIEALGKGIEAMEKNLQGLNAADRFLWAKIEAQSPEALIESRVNALKEQMEAYVAQLESEIVELAEKIEDQTLLNKLENRITALKGNLEMFIAKEEEQQTLIASMEGQTTKELESLNKTLAELKAYAENLKVEFEQAIDALSAKIGATENAAGKEEIEALQKSLDEAKLSLNTRAKWIDISIRSVKDEIAALSADLTKESVKMQDQLDSYKASTNQRLKWIDLTIAKNKDRVEAFKTDLKQAQEQFDSQLKDSLWALNQRLKWVDINTGNLRASLQKALDKIESNRVVIDQELEDMQTLVETNQTATNQRMKWTDISISNLNSSVQNNKEMIQKILNDMEDKEAENAEQIQTTDFDETIAGLNQRLKWMDIASASTKEQVEALENLLVTTEGELKQELTSAISNLNQRLKWMDIASTGLREKVEVQGDQIETVEAELKADLADKIYFINQRLKWMDIRMNSIKDESASQKELLSLKEEFDYNVSRLNTVAFEVAFSKGITEDILEKVSELEERVSILNNNFNMIISEFATKEMLEEEVAYIYQELAQVEAMTMEMGEESQQAIESAVWSINQRLKWVDLTIKKAREETSELSVYTKDLEERLQNDIDSKVLFINKRLKWMDISISNLKETKVDEKEYTKTVTKLEADKVDKDIFGEELDGISTRFISLEMDLDAFKVETASMLQAQREALEAVIGTNSALIQENAAAIENNETEIEALQRRIELLEAQVFPKEPEKQQPQAIGVLVGFGLVIGLGFAISSMAK